VTTFWQLTVPASPDTSDGLTNFLWEHGALGVVEEETASEPPTLRAFFPETASSTGLLAAVNAYRDSLRSLGFSVARAAPAITPLLDGDWARAWQQSFPPIEIGSRLLIVPPWEARPEGAPGGRLQLIIEPGRAFGTGHHGSTAGCLALLEDAIASHGAPPARVLDVGTGSGILAIAALGLGARAAIGIDVDPDAITAARRNAERNACAGRLALALESPEALIASERFPLVVANLLTRTHLAFAAIYARLVVPGGRLVLGGILADEQSQVSEAVGAAGFEPSRTLVVDGWAALLVARPPKP
jgi:ribosomal protein L11 methyltransferase